MSRVFANIGPYALIERIVKFSVEQNLVKAAKETRGQR